MDVNGLVIAASEVIKFEKGHGILLTICNLCKNIYFYILVKDCLLESWKKVCVNRYYKFFLLKIGAIEWLSGTRVYTFSTSLDSKFEEIQGHEQQQIILPHVLMNKISIPAITFNPEANSHSKIISYQGKITKIHSSDVGIYELDNKINLYCVFNSYRTSLPILRQGDEVFISNVHFFTDFRGYKVLACCGLSSVRPVVLEVAEDMNIFSSSCLSCYPLSIFDLIWLENLISKLNAKFYPSIVPSHFSWKDKIIENILACFSDPSSELSYPKVPSLGDEYCSNPHACSVFQNDILPTGCAILHISEILGKSFDKVSWSEISDNWKTSCIINETNNILIGMLYLSKDGCWYVTDTSCNVPVIFTKSCSSCELPINTFCLFDNLNLGYLIAVQNFCVVYEKIKYDCDKYISHRYIKTSCCYLFLLGTFFRQKDNVYSFVSDKTFSPVKSSDDYFVEELTESLKNTHLELDSKVKSPYNSEDFSNECVSQCVLALNKIWTVSNQTFMCYQILALLLPEEEISEEYFDKSSSLCNDTFDFYGSNDDKEFVELINQMDSLFLESKPMLARLHFESIKQCALMFPGHIYSVELSESFIKDFKMNKSSSKPVLIKIKPNMRVCHSLECRGYHHPDDYNINVYHGIKDIMSNRKAQENSLIRAVLKDKQYEENGGSCASQSQLEAHKTFCMTLKDIHSEDTLKMYLPFCPRNMYGFLPGTQLQMWGFLCICSRRGHLYLKPSSSFGIQIINSQPFEITDDSVHLQDELLHSEDKVRFSSLRKSGTSAFFKCICFIVKIISAKMFLVCNNCRKDCKERCNCFSSYSVKLNLSFIVDDGIEQMLVNSSNEAARKVLMLDEKEWEKLSSFVTNSRSQLNFHYKNDETDADFTSSVEHVFCIYCASKFLCRPAYLKCKKSGSLKTEEQTVWCHDVLDICDIDIIQELIMKVKGIDL